MRTSTLLAVALATLGASADSSTTTLGLFSPQWNDVEIPVLGDGQSSLVASLAGLKSSTTTYHIGCAKGAAKTDCNIPTSWTAIQGPDTVSFSAKYVASTSGKSTSYDYTVTESYECSLHSFTGSASCTMSAGFTGSGSGGDGGYSTSTDATYSTAPTEDYYYALTVTAGLKSLSDPAATATGAAVAGPAGAVITAAPVVMAAVAALL
ncbi:hypothetical protein N7540_010830 [Penicillium herquei]|nr:hypothetical protein N7540_010830 [Penicillium herquei]